MIMITYYRGVAIDFSERRPTSASSPLSLPGALISTTTTTTTTTIADHGVNSSPLSGHIRSQRYLTSPSNNSVDVDTISDHKDHERRRTPKSHPSGAKSYVHNLVNTKVLKPLASLLESSLVNRYASQDCSWQHADGTCSEPATGATLHQSASAAAPLDCTQIKAIMMSPQCHQAYHDAFHWHHLNSTGVEAQAEYHSPSRLRVPLYAIDQNSNSTSNTLEDLGRGLLPMARLRMALQGDSASVYDLIYRGMIDRGTVRLEHLEAVMARVGDGNFAGGPAAGMV